MYTADMARNNDQIDQDDLDRRIEAAVKDSYAGLHAGYLRVCIDDPWFDSIQYELERRGFKNVHVPDIVIKGDVYFEW